MRVVLPLLGISLLLLAGPVWSEEDDEARAAREAAIEAEKQELGQHARELLEQGSVDYQRLKQALAKIELQKAELARRSGSLRAMDQLARRAEMINEDIKELHSARMALDEAATQVRRGRFEAGKQAFSEAVARWASVHQRIVSHIGESPKRFTIPPRQVGELEALRKEVKTLRAEVEALRAEVRELRAVVQAGAR